MANYSFHAAPTSSIFKLTMKENVQCESVIAPAGLNIPAIKTLLGDKTINAIELSYIQVGRRLYVLK